VHGCTDSRATNYFEAANIDDGSCQVIGCATHPLHTTHTPSRP
jgi:hypothetical protein